MEKIFICQQCHAELGEDEVDGILGHAVPDYDEDGDVDGCNQCGPCEMNRDWALARIKSLKDCAAKMQKRILELAENEAVTSANYNGAVARIAELEAQLAAMQRIVDGYKDDLKIPENVLGVLKLAYRKHHLLDDSVGSTELSDFLMDTICELIGNDGFQEWLDELEQCNLDNRDIFVEEE